MKRLSIFIILIVSVFCLNAVVDWNITGAGARAAGMGGAFIGVADDATAIVWNPAGLVLLERPEASVVTRFVGDYYKYEVVDGDFEEEETTSHFIFNFGSGAIPLNLGSMKVVPAVAYQRQIDLYNYTKTEDYESEGLGGVDTITLGSGIQIIPVFSLGFAANLWLGKYTFESDNRADYEYEESYSGLNFVIGGMLDLNNLNNPIPLKLGVTFRTPFDLDIEYEDSDGLEGDQTLGLPNMIGFGASYRFGDFFTVSADYEMRTYSESKIKEDDNEWDLTDNDINQIRVGAEYLLVTDFAVIPIRGGWHNYPTLFSNVDEDGEFDDQVIGMGFAVGSGLIFQKFAFDVTFTYDAYEIVDKWWYETKENMAKSTISASAILYFD